MTASETITREDSLALWKSLTQDKTPLILKTPDGARQWQLLAREIRTRRRRRYLVVEDNETLRSALKDAAGDKMTLAFTDRNNVPHTCDIQHHRLAKMAIWLEMPETIERHQRRRIFRLEAPSGSELHLNIGGKEHSLLLIDVSINGALGIMSHLNTGPETGMPGCRGETIPDAVLLFRTKAGPQRIHIAECAIRRLEPHETTGKMQYALEFTTIDEENEQLLTKMIYEFQREYLRRRRMTR
jgi:c-di-GMP-binding flagellar brake protein YcgR